MPHMHETVFAFVFSYQQTKLSQKNATLQQGQMYSGVKFFSQGNKKKHDQITLFLKTVIIKKIVTLAFLFS